MNLQQFEYIIAVDRFRSFTKAAEYCNVTQATLSAMIKKLEEELDLVLFDRKNIPVVTTECGREIVDEARKVILHSEKIRQLPAQIKNHIVGQVRIGIIPTVASSLLPLIIKPIVTAYPELVIEWLEITTDQIVQQLKDGLLDAGILATPLQQQTDIEENILFYEKLMVYGQTEGRKQYLLPEELKQHKVWILEEGHCLRSQFMNLCKLEKKDLDAPFIFEPSSFETLINLVESFGGLTLLPELYCQQLSAEKQEKVLDFQAPYPVREVSMVYYRPYAKFRIIEALTEQIAGLIQPQLASSMIKNSDLVIVQI
ncbi:MAG: LysR family transcriptional regulator [Phaeodactylibacter sp.]|nr:LysR family transcriptional regulator [Phaeodactylibacter sp.]